MSETGLTRREVVALGLSTGAIRWRPLAVGLPRSTELSELVRELIAKHRIPGAMVATLAGGRTAAGAAGVANLNTGVPMTVDTGFLTGSITKVWTATLAMTFVDEGSLDLERPITENLPHFRWPGGTLTMWHLLNHSSGLDAGDLLLELGDGPLAHRRYVDVLNGVGRIHQPGAYSSYCNGGFILAGHLLEFISGKSFDRLMHERVIEPLGLGRTVLSADEAILHRTAVGSLPDSAGPGGHRATPKFLLPKSAAPAGSTLITTLGDQLAFAAMHLGRGQGGQGRRVLSERSAVAMATRTIGRPVGGGASGLGWGLRGQGASLRLAHSGGSNGGIAQLVVFPGLGVAYASFANSSSSYGFHNELQQRVLAELVPTPTPGPATGATPGPVRPLEGRRITGAYRRKSEIVTIETDGGKIMVEIKAIPEDFAGSEIYSSGQKTRFEVVTTGPAQLTSVEPVLLGQPQTFDFLEPRPDGKFDLLYTSNRLSRRVD